MSDYIYLLECKPWDPVAGATKNVYFAKGLLTESDLDASNPYILRLIDPYSHETSIFDNNSPGDTTISIGSSTINNVDGRLDYLLGYSWDGRQVTVKRGKRGDALGSYVTEWIGSSVEMVATNETLTIALRDNSYKLEKPIQVNKYLGTGAAEGGADIEGKRKPLLFGLARNLVPVLVDTPLLTYQIHDGAIASVDKVYDQGNPLTFHADYASYALLAAATIPPGRYGTSIATGFIRLGAPTAAGYPTVDAQGQYNSSTTIAALAQSILTGRFGLVSGDLNTASFTECAADAPQPYEGVYFQEPDFQMNELMETFASAINGFWYINRAGLITMRQFKFRTPVGSIRQEDILNLGKGASPTPIYRVIVNYGKNATVQAPDQFTFPKQTFNGYLEKYYQHSLNSSPSLTGPRFQVFLNSDSINALGQVTFRIPNGETWLAIDTDGDITFTDPGSGTTMSAVVQANFGEYELQETMTFVRDASSPLNALTLALSADRFTYDEFGAASPGGQVITITPTGTNTTAPITLSAVDNLGNVVTINGSNQISIANVPLSPLSAWITVTAVDANGVTQKAKIIIQRGLDGYANATLEALSQASSAITVYYQNTAPASPGVDDLWYDLDDANKVYRWTGSAWVLVADTRIVDALTQAAGAQATADGKIKTFFGESTPTATAIGDLWYKGSTKTLYRWDGSSWSTQVGTWGADWIASLSNIPANLGVLTGTEQINNQLVLNSIANDDVLSIAEKIGVLQKLDADLEGRYTAIMAGAVAEGLSTTALTNARTEWRNLLASYSPAWNNTTADTTIYSGWFADKLFPTNWTVTNASTTPSGIYTVVNDASGTQYGVIFRNKAQAAVATQYAAAIVIKKDTTAKTTRFPMLRIEFTGGTGKLCDVTMDTSTGQAVNPTNNVDDFGALDLGTEWLLYLVATSNATNTSANCQFYPAVGANANLTTYNAATTGSCTVRSPTMALGIHWKLGRDMLAGRLNAFQNEISKFNAQLASWAGVSGIPANLATLVGTESINNQLILNSIAADNVLSVQEKFDLVKLYNDMEARYTDLRARAVAVGLSVSSLDSARSDFRGCVGSYSPVWNDTTQDTVIWTDRYYTPMSGVFPNTWGAEGTGLNTNVVGAYVQTTESNAAAVCGYYKDAPINPSEQWSVGVRIKKQTVSNAVNLRILFYGGVTRNYDVIFRQDTGAILYNGGSNAADGYAVYDLGDEIFACIVMTAGADNTAARVEIYPAARGNTSGGFDNTTTGDVYIKGAPVLAKGWTYALGRMTLTAVLYYYSRQMVLLAQQISDFDSSTTDWIDGPSAANVLYDNGNTTIQANVDLGYAMKSGAGTIVTSGVTASYVVVDGNVNGFNSTSGAQTLTVTSGATTFTVSAMTTDTAVVLVKMTRNGLTKSLQLNLTKTLAAPSGGGGGGGGGSAANQTSGFTALNTGPSTFSQITNTLSTGSVPAGKTLATIAVNLAPKMNRSQSTIAFNDGPWNIQYKLRRNISGTRSDVGSPASANSNPDPYCDYVDETGNTVTIAGSMVQNFTFSVSSGTTYDFEIWATISSGTFSATYPVNFTGSVTVTLS